MACRASERTGVVVENDKHLCGGTALPEWGVNAQRAQQLHSSSLNTGALCPKRLFGCFGAGTLCLK